QQQSRRDPVAHRQFALVDRERRHQRDRRNRTIRTVFPLSICTIWRFTRPAGLPGTPLGGSCCHLHVPLRRRIRPFLLEQTAPAPLPLEPLLVRLAGNRLLGNRVARIVLPDNFHGAWGWRPDRVLYPQPHHGGPDQVAHVALAPVVAVAEA